MNIKRAKQEIKDAIEAYLLKDEYGAYVIPQIRQRPVLLLGGRIVGQWDRKGTAVVVEPFVGEKRPSARLLRSAEGRWKLFREGQAFS